MADNSTDNTDTLPIVLNHLKNAFPEKDCGHEGYLSKLRHYREEINNFLDKRELLVENNARVLDEVCSETHSGNTVQQRSTGNISDTDQQSLQAIQNSEPRTLIAHFQHHIQANSHCYIAGMTILMEKYLVFCDAENKVVKVMNLEKEKEESIIWVTQLASSPRGVACLRHDYIAVTMPEEKQINIFKYQNNSLQNEGKVNVPYDCYGIDYMDDRLLVTYVTPPGFGVFDIIDTPTLSCTNRFEVLSTTDISDTTETHERPLYIKGIQIQNTARFIVVSDEKSGYLKVYSWENGNLIQELKDPRFRQPRGLALYNADQLLVVFRESDSIVMFKINEHGELHCDCIVLNGMLSTNRYLRKPCVLVVSANKRLLYVSCQFIEARPELKNNMQVYKMS